ncbi:MAG: ATP-binding protein [Methanobrevibacter sp.]|nr:ATP-binding protein [Methanobrevibacter sp.]
MKVNESFILNALRNCGYNNYTAIADIIDNSIEPDVESTFVRVCFETEGKGNETTINSILIVDDGIGMTLDTLKESMNLGSQTGKNAVDNLGMYGTGLKAASLSLGQVLEIFTKTEDSKLNYATLSIEKAIEKREGIEDSCDECDENSEKWDTFKKYIKGSHGTIIKISKLDRLANKNYRSFKATLKNKLGEFFNKFIYGEIIKFYVEKDEVPYVELMGNIKTNDLMREGNFEVDGHIIKYKAYHIPRISGYDELEEVHQSKNDGSEYITRTQHNQGLYIYRNNRLVGKGLTFGMWSRHSLFNGFRCEIYVDGTCDYLFGSTFTKVVSEKDRSNMSEALMNKLINEIKPLADDSRNREKRKDKEDKVSDPEAIKATQEFYKMVAEKQNKNKMLSANRSGENHKREEIDEREHQVRGKQKNPNPIKVRTNKWLGGFDERQLGRHGEMYCIEHNDSKPNIIINTDHPFYQEFYSNLADEHKFIMAQIISCDEIAKQRISYYLSDDVRNIIDCYEDVKSAEVMKSLSY